MTSDIEIDSCPGVFLARPTPQAPRPWNPEWLNWRRRKLGLSLEEAAAKCKIAPDLLQKYESGDLSIPGAVGMALRINFRHNVNPHRGPRKERVTAKTAPGIRPLPPSYQHKGPIPAGPKHQKFVRYEGRLVPNPRRLFSLRQDAGRSLDWVAAMWQKTPQSVTSWEQGLFPASIGYNAFAESGFNEKYTPGGKDSVYKPGALPSNAASASASASAIPDASAVLKPSVVLQTAMPTGAKPFLVIREEGGMILVVSDGLRATVPKEALAGGITVNFI